MSEIDAPSRRRQKVSLFELAWTFNHIALASFGGGLSAWSREVLVVEKKWMGEAEFLVRHDDVPDPARRQSGQHGGVRRHQDARPSRAPSRRCLGLCLMPLVDRAGAGFVYFRFKEVPAVKGVLHGASAAAVALTLAMVDQDRPEVPDGPRSRSCCSRLAFVLNGVLRWPLAGGAGDRRAAERCSGRGRESQDGAHEHLPAARPCCSRRCR